MLKVLIATLPVLFPMFFISGLLIELNFLRLRGVKILSHFTGFPTSARMINILYTRGEITKQQAFSALTQTSVVSPAFIILSLGLSMYGDIRIGIFIVVAQIIGALLNGRAWLGAGIAFKRFAPALRYASGDTCADTQLLKSTPAPPRDKAEIISKTLHSSVKSTIKVGVLIAFFYVLTGFFGTFVASFLELTTGVYRVETLLGANIWRVIIPTAIVSFGGLSVAMQGQIFLRPIGIKLWLYLTYKATQMIFSCVIAAILYFSILPLW